MSLAKSFSHLPALWFTATLGLGLGLGCGGDTTHGELSPVDSNTLDLGPDHDASPSDVADSDSASLVDTETADTKPPDTTPADSDTPEVDTHDTQALDTALDEVSDSDGADGDSDTAADTSETDTTPPPLVLPVAPTGPPCSYYTDCTPPAWNCDPTYKVCVQCVVRTDCGWDRDCVAGVCVGEGRPKCTYDYQCVGSPYGPACLPLRMVCGECYEDWQCPDGDVCQDNTCVPGTRPPPCDNSLDCPGLQVCSPVKKCVDCTGDGDCPGTARCRNWRCVEPETDRLPPNLSPPRPCSGSVDCKDLGGVSCNLAIGFCNAGPVCRNDADCASTYHCTDNYCVPDQCRPEERYCYSRCTQDGVCLHHGDGLHLTTDALRHCDDRGLWESSGEVCHQTGYWCGVIEDPYTAAECGPDSYHPSSPHNPTPFCVNAYQFVDLANLASGICQCSETPVDHCTTELIEP